MSFTTSFTLRDLTTPANCPLPANVQRLSWSAFGGPDQAQLRFSGDQNLLMDLVRYIRYGVLIQDHNGLDVWWGYVQDVVIVFGNLQIKLSLENLFNKVKVKYTFHSPDAWPGQSLETSFASISASINEYGTREKVISISNTDDDFAEDFRDTFLDQHAFPFSILETPAHANQKPCAIFNCLGWFHTLKWTAYTNSNGYIENTKPGPGTFAFGNAASTGTVGQSFTPSANMAVSYIDVKLRNIGSATRNVDALIATYVAGAPSSYIGTSTAIAASTIPTDYYQWTRFTFSTPVSLTGGTAYIFRIRTNGFDAAKYLQVKLDENLNFTNGVGKYANSGSWTAFTPEADLAFRIIGLEDSGTQLYNIADDADQFFSGITTLSTSLSTCPFRSRNLTAYKEIQSLMKLGTSNQHLVLASVSPTRHLTFYEQPDKDNPDIFINSAGRFWDSTGIHIPAYLPPVGRWAIQAASPRISFPWDKERVPACFIAGATHYPDTGQTTITPQ